MAKPGQKITKGLLPNFRFAGNKPKPQGERGTCQRCGDRKGSKHLKEQTIAGITRKVCDECHSARNERVAPIGGKLYDIEQKAMERFRNGQGSSSMVQIGPRRKRGRK